MLLYELEGRIFRRGCERRALRDACGHHRQVYPDHGHDRRLRSRMREPYVKHLQGPLWEMRMKGKDGIARAAYVTAAGKRVVVVHVFPKKTQKTPRREIEEALRRAKEVK